MNHTRTESNGMPEGSLTIACTSGVVVEPRPSGRARYPALGAVSADYGAALDALRLRPFRLPTDSREGHLNTAAAALEGSKAPAKFDLRAVALRLVCKGANQAGTFDHQIRRFQRNGGGTAVCK